jgi:hypothetical protein
MGIASRDKSRCAHSDNDRSAEGLGGTGYDPTVSRIGKANEMHLKQATSPTILWPHRKGQRDAPETSDVTNHSLVSATKGRTGLLPHSLHGPKPVAAFVVSSGKERIGLLPHSIIYRVFCMLGNMLPVWMVG